MKNISILFISLCSQIQLAQKINLDEAIKSAFANRIELKTQGLQIELSQLQDRKIKAKWMPQVNTSADVRWNTQLQTTVLPFDITGTNPGESSKVKFGLPFNNVLGLQVDQKIFDPSAGVDKMIYSNGVQNNQQQLEKIKSDIATTVREAYYAAVFNKEQVAIAMQQVERYQSNLISVETKYSNGTILQNDFEKSKLELTSAQSQLQKAQNEFAYSLAQLKYQMNSKQPVTDIEDDLKKILTAGDAHFTIDYNSRSEIKIEELEIQNKGLELQKQKSLMKPSVSAYGSYGLLQLSKYPNPFQSGSWFPYNYLGLRVQMPLYNGNQMRITSQEYLLQQQIHKQNIEKLQSEFEFEAMTAKHQMDQARLDINEGLENIEQARKIYTTDMFRLEKGILLPSEVKTSEFNLLEAEKNYLKTVFNFLIAKIKYQKAIGDL